jgi:hypothetical protein
VIFHTYPAEESGCLRTDLFDFMLDNSEELEINMLLECGLDIRTQISHPPSPHSKPSTSSHFPHQPHKQKDHPGYP